MQTVTAEKSEFQGEKKKIARSMREFATLLRRRRCSGNAVCNALCKTVREPTSEKGLPGTMMRCLEDKLVESKIGFQSEEEAFELFV